MPRCVYRVVWRALRAQDDSLFVGFCALDPFEERLSWFLSGLVAKQCQKAAERFWHIIWRYGSSGHD
jgi:hypothetical protein